MRTHVRLLIGYGLEISTLGLAILGGSAL